MQYEKEELYGAWLCSVPGFGPRTIKKMLEQYGSFEEIYANRNQIMTQRKKKDSSSPQIINSRQQNSFITFAKQNSPESLLEKYQKQKVSFVSFKNPLFPKKLLVIPDSPVGLFYIGSLPSGDTPSVSMIGARMCSEYGRYLAREFGKALAMADIQVISGLAMGIDGISQKSALEHGGKSYGIMGCGCDICYPEENQAVYDMLITNGGIISEYPPGTMPKPGLFPLRNRIISGLSDVVLVIEAKQKSGTLITVDMALEQGREVYAVPGRITDRLSDGCNSLIRQGAGIALNPQDIVNFFARPGAATSGNESSTNTAALLESTVLLPANSLEQAMLSVLDLNPKPITIIYEELSQKGLQLSVPQVMDTLVHMSLRNMIIQDGTFFRLK